VDLFKGNRIQARKQPSVSTTDIVGDKQSGPHALGQKATERVCEMFRGSISPRNISCFLELPLDQTWGQVHRLIDLHSAWYRKSKPANGFESYGCPSLADRSDG